ncbi:MAG: DUF1127 domain-containing protein [Pseudomonadota bacterium]
MPWAQMAARVMRWRQARDRRAARRELEGYDDLQLADLGICRADIPAYVAGLLQARPAGPALKLVVDNAPASGPGLGKAPACCQRNDGRGQRCCVDAA